MTNWNKNEFLAYIMLYAAHSDFNESNSERNIILSKVDVYDFQKIKDEFEKDSDYQCIQKIIEGLKQHNFTQDNIDELLTDLKVLFFSDGNFDIQEQTMLMYLQKLLH